MQTDVLNRRPDNRETTRLRRKHIDLICPLSHVTKEALNGIGRLNVAVHRLRKVVKRQEVLFILRQASYGFWIAHRIFGFESGQLDQCLRLCGLLPDANQFGLHISARSLGDSGKHIALFMHQTALTRRRRKQLRDGREQPVMPIGHDQIDLSGPSSAQIEQDAEPSLFAFLGARPQGQYLLVACQIHGQGRQNDRGVGFLPMTDAKMHPIQVQDMPVFLKPTLAPGVELLGQALAEATDRAGDFPPLP